MGFNLFETDSISCTFAEILIDDDVRIDPSLIKASFRALDAIDAATPFSVLKFPEDGFLYFSGVSVAELASRIRHNGDEDLAHEVEETIFKAKTCWRRSVNRRSTEFQRYAELILDREGIVVLGAEPPNTVILLYPSESRAFYFGP